VSAPEDAGAHLRITELAERVDVMDRQLLALVQHFADLAEAEGDDAKAPPYTPRPPVKWWSVQGPQREDAIGYLEAWARDIYLPGFGHLAAMLPDCWTGHPLCLYSVEAISEMFLLLEMAPRRSAGTLAGLIELLLRTVPAAARQMADECASCPPGHAAQVTQARAQDRAGAP
jgi:hypothetical protein